MNGGLMEADGKVSATIKQKTHMKIDHFEDIIAWQKARELAVLVYGTFAENRDYGFKDQIQRASVSVMNNIAEGFEKKSDREFRQGLFIAKASCAEVRSTLCLARDLNMLTGDEYQTLHDLSRETSRVLSGLIKSLR